MIEQTEQPKLEAIFDVLILLVKRQTADQHVQLFTGNNIGGFLLHLVLGKMRQEIRNAKSGVIRLVSDINRDL